jgi:hypothetical protein
LPKGQPIANYKEFVDTLETNLRSFEQKPKVEWQDIGYKMVDGLAAEEVRRHVSLKTRRRHGIFFTNSELAQTVFKKLKPKFNAQSIIYDPACGAGNLIIAVANFIHDKKITLNDGEHFYGTDIHSEFVEASKLRCTINQLLALPQDLKTPSIVDPNFSFAQLDGLESNGFYNRATDIIVNPPYSLISTKDKLSWSKGKVSAAALFIDKIIQHVKPGTNIYAVLPDVLRSGSRYEKWRQMIQEKCITGPAHLLGQFDEHADVDVFAIKLIKRKNKISVSQPKRNFKSKEHPKTIEDLFDVCVGPVVDNRDPKKGKKLKYIISKGLKGWTKQTDVKLKRKHQGKSFKSPFVVVKRTSRMGDSERAIATIINIPQPVFVDNHLIILNPRSDTLKTCKKILEILKDKKTDRWLNKKIRCRHLTVKIVCKIPIWE